MKTYSLFLLTSLLLGTTGLVSQAQKTPKSVGSVAPGAKSPATYSVFEMSQLVNTGTLGSQPTKLPTQNGTYGILFQDYKAYNLYKDRILDHLDDFIEAASFNLDPSDKVITNEIMQACYEYMGQLERQNKDSDIDESPYFGDYNYYYAIFSQLMRQALKQTKWRDYITDRSLNSAGSKFLQETIYNAALQQCASHCSQSFQQFGTMSNAALGTFMVASRLNYLFSYDNVAKQNNPIYKALYDAYVARKTAPAMASYRPLSQYHGSQMPFTLYQLPFGKLAPTYLDSEKMKSFTSVLWDKTCNCPSAASFVNALEAQNTFFTLP